MKPYEPAVGKSLFGFEKAKSILDDSFKKDMIMDITTWWLEGKISDDDYLKSLEKLTGWSDYEKRVAGGFASADRATMILTEPPKLTAQDTTKDDVSEWSEQKILDIQEMITYTREQKRLLTEEEVGEDFPQWFKSRALWWVNEKIDNEDFISGLGFFFNH